MKPICHARSIILFLSFAAFLSLAAEGNAQQPDPGSEGRLKGLSLEQLGNIEVITASKSPVKLSQTAAAVYVITQDDIRRSGVTSLPEALRLAPGVDVAQIDSVKWAVGIRGFQSRLSREVLVLIDGRSVYSPLFHGVYWEVQDTLLEDIDRIEVIRGPGGTIWGANAVDGVINIITKSAKDTRGTLVSAGGGTVAQGFMDVRQGGGNDAFSYRIYGKGYDQGPESHSDGREFDDWRRAQGGFRTDWKIDDRDTLTVQGDIYDGVAGESVRITTLSPPSIVNVDQNAQLSGGNVLARWQRTSEERVRHSSAGLLRQSESSAGESGRVPEHLRRGFCAPLHAEQAAGFHLGAGREMEPGQRFRKSSRLMSSTPISRTDHVYTAYAQDQISLLENRLQLTFGAKLLHSSFTGFDVEPSAEPALGPHFEKDVLGGSDTRGENSLGHRRYAPDHHSALRQLRLRSRRRRATESLPRRHYSATTAGTAA